MDQGYLVRKRLDHSRRRRAVDAVWTTAGDSRTPARNACGARRRRVRRLQLRLLPVRCRTERFFPLYAAGVLLGIAALGAGISRLDAGVVARGFREGTPVRLIGGYLVFVAASLALVWLGMWAAYAFAGRRHERRARISGRSIAAQWGRDVWDRLQQSYRRGARFRAPAASHHRGRAHSIGQSLTQIMWRGRSCSTSVCC